MNEDVLFETLKKEKRSSNKSHKKKTIINDSDDDIPVGKVNGDEKIIEAKPVLQKKPET